MNILLINVDSRWNMAIRKMYTYYSKDNDVTMIDLGFSGYLTILWFSLNCLSFSLSSRSAELFVQDYIDSLRMKRLYSPFALVFELHSSECGFPPCGEIVCAFLRVSLFVWKD